MKKNFLIILCAITVATMTACQPKSKINTGDKQLDSELQKIYNDLQEENKDSSKETITQTDSKFTVSDIYKTSLFLPARSGERNCLTVVYEFDDPKITSYNDLFDKYFIDLKCNYYGEESILSFHNGILPAFTPGLYSANFEQPTEFPVEDYTYTFMLTDRNTREIAFSKELKFSDKTFESQNNPLYLATVDKIKSGGIDNNIIGVDIDLDNVNFTYDDILKYYSIYFSFKFKNNNETLVRIDSNSLLGHINSMYSDLTYEGSDSDLALKPGEEKVFIFKAVLDNKNLEAIKSWNLPPIFVFSDTNENDSFILDNNVFIKAIKNYIN